MASLSPTEPEDNLSDLEALEERLDIEDARAARREAQEQGTISLDALKRELV